MFSGLLNGSRPRLTRKPASEDISSYFVDYLSNVCRTEARTYTFKVGLISVRQPSKWTGTVCAVVCVHAVVSLLAARGVGLTAFGDLTQCVLLLCATLGILSNTRTRDKKEQLFWGLMGLGCGMWLCAQVLWTYFEVFLRQEAPNPFVADVVFFLHIVPMMAALVVQPHLLQNEHSLRLGSVDFFLLLTWWLYLYLFVVIPWQYVAPNEDVYGRSFDLLYACEQIVLIAGSQTGLEAQPRLLAHNLWAVSQSCIALQYGLDSRQCSH